MKIKRQTFFIVIRLVGVFIMGLIVAIFVALSQINMETLRGNILGILQNATNAPVEINGKVSWKFSLRPRIELHNVRVPNEYWAQHDYAFSAERVDVRLNLLSLFHNRPTIQNVKIYDSTIALEQNEKGEYSVKRLKPENPVDVSDSGTANEETSKTDIKTQPEYPFADLGLGGIEFRNVVAHILGDTYSLAGFFVHSAPEHDRRKYIGWMKLDKNVLPFIVVLSKYNQERRVYPVQIALSTGDDAVVADVALEGTSLMPIDFVIKGDIPDAQLFGCIFNIDLSDVPPITINLVGGMDRQKIKLRSSSLKLRETNFNLSGSIDWSKKIPAIDVDIKSDSVNLVKIFPNLYGNGTWIHPKRDLNIFHDMPLHGDELYDLNLTLRVAVKNLYVYRKMNIRDTNISLKLKDAHARLDATANVAGGDVRVGSNIDISPDGRIDLQIGVSGQKVSVGEILNQINIASLISDLPANIEFYGVANGTNMSELMQTMTGPIQVYSSDAGYAHSELVENVYGADFLTNLRHGIQDLFRSNKKYNQMKISCVAVNTIFRNGLAETRQGVAVETNAINVRLAGDVDLGKETINLSLTTVPVRGIKLSLTGNVVNSIGIVGNLAEPDIQISGAAVAGKVASATGIGLLLAPLTGGIGLVAGAGIGLVAGDLLENWLADDHPCETAMERGAPVFRNDPEWLRTPVAVLVDDVLNNKIAQ